MIEATLLRAMSVSLMLFGTLSLAILVGPYHFKSSVLSGVSCRLLALPSLSAGAYVHHLTSAISFGLVSASSAFTYLFSDIDVEMLRDDKVCAYLN